MGEECPAPWEAPGDHLFLLGGISSLLFVLVFSKLKQLHIFYHLKVVFECLQPVPLMEVETTAAEAKDDGVTGEVVKGKPSIRDINKPGFIQCYDPSTGQFLGEVKAMNAQDVHDCCVKASVAQKEWAKTTFAERRKVLRTLQQYVVNHVEDICRVSSRDSGKPMIDACLGEVLTTCEKIRTINCWGELWLQPSYRPTGPLMMHKIAFVEYVPMGIIAPIAPWNYPFHNFVNHIISGIFAGNAVVGKVSEHTAWSSQYFTKMVQQALIVHGHNPDLLQTITGFADAGAALCSEPLVDKIIFTGSPGIGRKVMETASHHLKPVVLELGGKDAMVILEDVKLAEVYPWVMRGCYQNCGQNCVGIERVMVYDSIYDQFLDGIKPMVDGLRQGVPLATNPDNSGDVDCGSMVTEEQLSIIQGLVDDAVSKGARVVSGGKRNTALSGAGQQFFEPTIVADVTPEMRLFKEEAFGPIMTVMKVPNNDDAVCVDMVNRCDFGLGSSVYCGDQSRGLSIGRQFRTGMFCVNDFGSNYLVQALPFGGVKESGFGRFAGPEGLQSLCLERSILIDRASSLVRTSIPPPLSYPIDKSKGIGFANSLIGLFYDESLIGKVKAIIGLIKNGS